MVVWYHVRNGPFYPSLRRRCISYSSKSPLFLPASLSPVERSLSILYLRFALPSFSSMLSILAKLAPAPTLDLVPQLPSLNRLPPSTGDASFLSVSIVHASSETILTQSSSGSTHMTWKDRKDSENRKVVALGGKPPKNQRLPLSVARVTMKKQKQRDQKLQEERMVLGRFGGMLGNGSKRATEKRRPENKVLKSTERYFRNGVLNVKNLLKPGATRELDRSINTLSAGFDNPGKKKGGFGKKKGKKKGGGKKHC